MRGEPGRPPLPPGRAAAAVGRCVARTARLLVAGRIRQPAGRVGDVLHFGDGTAAPVYRETVVRPGAAADPAALVVTFRLRGVRGRGHAVFRAESILNIPLFVGFPGFVSKLWLADDERGAYRGLYEWDGAERAHAYARALWWVLSLVSVRGSIQYTVIPGCTRAELLAGAGPEPSAGGEWWRVTGVDRIRS